MIKIINITKKYKKKTVLNNLSFEFGDCGFYEIRGESGCGKTTLVKILLGLIKPNSGEVIIDGYSSNVMKTKHKNKIREDLFYYCSQSGDLISNSSISENIKIIKTDDQEYYQSLLKDFNLLGKLTRKIKYLSGGERKIVSVIRALISNKKYIVIDEPFSGLDKDIKAKLLKCLLEISKERTLIIINHDMKIDHELFTNRIDLNEPVEKHIERGEVKDNFKVKEKLSFNFSLFKQIMTRNISSQFVSGLFLLVITFFISIGTINILYGNAFQAEMISKLLPSDNYVSHYAVKGDSESVIKQLDNGIEKKICISAAIFSYCGDDSLFEFEGRSEPLKQAAYLDVKFKEGAAISDQTTVGFYINGIAVIIPVTGVLNTGYFDVDTKKLTDYEYEVFTSMVTMEREYSIYFPEQFIEKLILGYDTLSEDFFTYDENFDFVKELRKNSNNLSTFDFICKYQNADAMEVYRRGLGKFYLPNSNSLKDELEAINGIKTTFNNVFLLLGVGFYLTFLLLNNKTGMRRYKKTIQSIKHCGINNKSNMLNFYMTEGLYSIFYFILGMVVCIISPYILSVLFGYNNISQKHIIQIFTFDWKSVWVTLLFLFMIDLPIKFALQAHYLKEK